MEYTYKKTSFLSYDETISKVKDELAKEGFGVLTEIYVKETMKNKLGVDIDQYSILGACNPKNAFKALKAEQDVGLMLPCNIIVYDKDEKTYVATILPSVAMGMIENETLGQVAHLIEEKLKKVIDNI